MDFKAQDENTINVPQPDMVPAPTTDIIKISVTTFLNLINGCNHHWGKKIGVYWDNQHIKDDGTYMTYVLSESDLELLLQKGHELNKFFCMSYIETDKICGAMDKYTLGGFYNKWLLENGIDCLQSKELNIIYEIDMKL
jgi:hypothetical protein